MTSKSNTKLGHVFVCLIIGLIIGASTTYTIKPTGVSQGEHEKVVGERNAARNERDALKETNTQLENQLKAQKDSYESKLKNKDTEIQNLQAQIKKLNETVKPCYGSDLHISGNKIVDKNGNVVVIRGVAYIDFAHADRSAKLGNDLREMAEEWYANAVRLPVHGIPSEQYLTNWLDKMVDAAEANGMYAVIDCHWNEANLDSLKAFWSTVAPRYANRTHVLYEVMNEPHDISWQAWKQIAEAAIDEIRKYNPNKLVIVNGLEWGYDLSYVLSDPILSDPINRTGVIYGTHPYPNKFWHCGGLNAKEELKRAEWARAFGKVAEKYPVVVTEFGWDGLTNHVWGNGDNELYAYPLLEYLDECGIGYLAWNWSGIGFYDPALLKSFATYEPSYSGEVIKKHLIEHNKLPS